MDSLLWIKQFPQADVTKGKMVVQYPREKQGAHQQKKKQRHETTMRWQAPSSGWIKLNVDGLYMQVEGVGGAGMVLRNSEGEIIFSSC
jgi:hypothetical protein